MREEEEEEDGGKEEEEEDKEEVINKRGERRGGGRGECAVRHVTGSIRSLVHCSPQMSKTIATCRP